MQERDNVTSSEVRNAARQASEKGRQVAADAQEQVREMADQAQQQVKSTVEMRKDQAVSELGQVADAFRSTGDHLRTQEKGTVARYADQVADQVEQLTHYLDDRDVDELLEDTEDFARRQPELFLGGAFAVGLFFGRFLKSSQARRMTYQDNRFTPAYRPRHRVSSGADGSSYSGPDRGKTGTQPSYQPAVSGPNPGGINGD